MVLVFFFQFFNYVSYVIGGELFTLQDIENGVLRGNRRGIAQLWKPFSESDPRLQVTCVKYSTINQVFLMIIMKRNLECVMICKIF